MTDLISVIVPVYNVEKYVRQTLDSVINQTYRNLEILVIDDGSTDGSPDICDEYLKDDRVKVFHRQNFGVAASRQFGVEACSGTYFVTLDADDYVSADFVEKLYDAIIRNEADVSVCGVSCFTDGKDDARTVYMPYGRYEKLAATKELLHSDLYRLFNELLLSDSWNKMYRTQLVRNSGAEFHLPDNGNELGFNINLTFHSPVYCVCNESLLFHRIRQGSLVQRKNNSLQEGFEIITENLIEESGKLGLSIREQLSNVYYWLVGNVVMDIIYRGGNARERHGRYRTLIRRNRQFLKKHSDNLDRHTGLTRFKLGDSSIHLPAFVLGNVLWLDAASMGIIILRKIKYGELSL
ncbi:MAG: glycosyltransferase family 2 protein [bacterium]|nr:glycosyltransferase family 2 protein [Candidatus Limimorpha caballi]